MIYYDDGYGLSCIPSKRMETLINVTIPHVF